MVRQKLCLRLTIEKILEIDNVESMSAPIVETKLEINSVDDVLEIIKKIVIDALKHPFSFL